MRLPPEPVVRAAARWLEILPVSGGVRRAQALLNTHTQYSDLTPTQYATALSWLRELDLVDTVESPVPAGIRLLSAIFEKTPPPWFRDADELIRSPDELPTDILAVARGLGVEASLIFDQLTASWGKVDTEAREQVGAAGELALVDLLSRTTYGQVDRVSTWSDGYGYDIAYRDGPVVSHLEVKSTTRSGRFAAYLSRHEFDVMLRDKHWTLIAVRLDRRLELAGVGSVPNDWIIANVPHDSSELGSWSTCKLEVPIELIANGIPELGPAVGGVFPAW